MTSGRRPRPGSPRSSAWRKSRKPFAVRIRRTPLCARSKISAYVLATGNRPYVLVDAYGGMNALPRMINDKSIRTKDVVAFLEKAFPVNSLPTVDVAKALVAAHRKAQLAFDKAQLQQGQFDTLKKLQADRRSGLEDERAKAALRNRAERFQLEGYQREARAALRHDHVQASREIRTRRYAHRATGLAAFLGRVTGVAAVIRKVHKAQDAARLRDYRDAKTRAGGDAGSRAGSSRAEAFAPVAGD